MLPVAGVAFVSGCIANDNFETKLWRSKFAEAEQKYSSQVSKLKGLEEELKTKEEEMSSKCPNWNKNWDGRHDKNVRPGKDATRTILFIRHGQYHDYLKEREDKTLTELGKEQAHLTGKRLQEFGFKYNKLIISTMPRAKETGEIIHQYIGDPEVVYSSLIEEGNPGPRIPSSKEWNEKKYGKTAKRIEEGFHTFVHRCDTGVTEPQIDVVVCHANVIRSYVCRALQIPIECWLRFGGYNGGITGIKISSSGNASLIFLGDVGFLPSEKVTFSTKERSHLLNLDKKRSSFEKKKEESK